MKNNPFENHSVEYLSATQINEFIANPARWILWQTGFRDQFGNPAMWRGIAVDQTITESLENTDLSVEECCDIAQIKFQIEHQMAQDLNIPVDETKLLKEENRLNKFIEAAVPYFRDIGKPNSSQQRIELRFPELPIPIIGYTDLQYDGIVRDIKTTDRLPKEIPSGTKRQLAIYAAAENAQPIVDYVYVTTKLCEVKTVTIDEQTVTNSLNEVRRACQNIMNLLSYSSDIHEVASLVFPNFDDWRWSKDEIIEAKKIWRI
tara:strand:+ start:2057 stop:2839 length:783 start_codon:yes stop_codon:yes gene_type:complete